MSRHWTQKLVALGACTDAVSWTRGYPTLSAAWAACDRGDWVLWLAGRVAGGFDSASHRRVVLAAVTCARLARRHWTAQTAPECALALRLATRYGREEPVGRADLRRAVGDAYAVGHAYAVVHAAIHAAAAYAVAAAAADATHTPRPKTLARCADLVRRYYPRPPRLR